MSIDMNVEILEGVLPAQERVEVENIINTALRISVQLAQARQESQVHSQQDPQPITLQDILDIFMQLLPILIRLFGNRG